MAACPNTTQSVFHPGHLLTLVNKRVNHRPCDLCCNPLHGLSYTCRTCGCFNAHPLCTQRPPPRHRQPSKPKPRNLQPPPPPMYRQPSQPKPRNLQPPPVRMVNNYRQPPMMMSSCQQQPMMMVNYTYQQPMMVMNNYQLAPAMTERQTSSGSKTKRVGSFLEQLAVSALTTAIIGVPLS